MQILITNDGRPILQNVTVPEALAFVAGYEGLRPVPMRQAVPGKPERPGLPALPQMNVKTSRRQPSSPALPGILDQVPPRPLTATVPRTDRKPHARGEHPYGPIELTSFIQQIENRRNRHWLARKLGVSTSMIRHLALADRGTSPRTLEKIFRVLEEEQIPITTETMERLREKTAARAHRLPKTWRNAQ